MTAARLGAGRYIDAAEAPSNTVTSTHELTTADGAKVSGVLRTVPGADVVVALMHPRQDLTHHVLVPELLARGYAVWTQGTRSVDNDIWDTPVAAPCSPSTTSRPVLRRSID